MGGLFARFTEPSSWSPIGGVLLMLGINAPGPVLASVGYIGAGICGLLAFFLPEGSAAPATPVVKKP
jgi:hypothetical protein